MNKEFAIEARHLSKRFGDLTAVKDVNLVVNSGECFGLLGPNGAGKSTMAKMIYAFSPVTSGELKVLGKDIQRFPRLVKARLGVVAQEDNLDPELTVRENLFVYAGYFRLDKHEASRRADEILEFMGLSKKADAIVETLSGGQKRRLTIGRALINRPDLLILDEPTTGLDPFARRLVWQRLRQLKEQGTTMLLTTHYLEEASQLCDRLLILHKGEILEEGVPSELIKRHVGKEALELGVPLHERERIKAWAEPLTVASHEFGDDFVLFTEQGSVLSQRIEENAAKTGIVLSYERLRPTNLEDVFLKLAGESLMPPVENEDAENVNENGQEEQLDQQEEQGESGGRDAQGVREDDKGGQREREDRGRRGEPSNRGDRETKVAAQKARMRRARKAFRLPDWSWPLIAQVFMRNLKVFAKTWKANIMFNFLEPLLYLWAMGFGLGVYVSQIQGLSYLQFLAPGLIASSAMFATTYEMTYGSYTRMAQQKIFYGMVATPVSLDDVLMGEILYGTFKGVLYGAVFFVVVALFGIAKSWIALGIFLPLVLMAMLFSILSLIWTAIAPNYDSFGYFFTLFISPMFLFAGIFFPIDNLPAGARFLPWLTPLYHAVAVVRPLVLGQGYQGMLGHLVWLLVLVILTIGIPLIMVKNKLIR